VIARSIVSVGIVSMLWTAVVSAAPETVEPDRDELRQQLAETLAAGDLDGSVPLAEQVAFAELVDYLDASYELLRIHCRRGDEKQAFDTVESMFEAGYWDFRRMMKDEDLALVNTTDRFRAMVRAAWSKQYIGMLERDTRDAMQHPDEIMQRLGIRPGDVVADVGAGSGYFTIPVARAVGADGRVIATDIRQEMLDFISARLAEEGITNVELVKVEPDDPGLPDGTVDLVLMVDVMHYVKERAAYGRRLRSSLSADGRLVVIDFRYDPEAQREFAPPPEQQVPRETLDLEMAEAGFEVVESHDFLPEQYFVIYRAAE
jgi:SAM-dependent methyltransferase